MHPAINVHFLSSTAYYMKYKIRLKIKVHSLAVKIREFAAWQRMTQMQLKQYICTKNGIRKQSEKGVYTAS